MDGKSFIASSRAVNAGEYVTPVASEKLRHLRNVVSWPMIRTPKIPTRVAHDISAELTLRLIFRHQWGDEKPAKEQLEQLQRKLKRISGGKISLIDYSYQGIQILFNSNSGPTTKQLFEIHQLLSKWFRRSRSED